MTKQHIFIIENNLQLVVQSFFHLSHRTTVICKSNYHMIMTTTHHAGLDINVCPIPVKTDVGQVDLVLRLSDGTSEKMTVLPIGGYFL
jgi:hypothetical protein